MPRSSRIPSDRTTRGAELDLSLSGVPRGGWGTHIVEELRDAIVTGRLAAEASLPSSRRLAADLGVSRGIVVDAYEQLVAEGHIVTSNGGSRIAGHSAAAAETETVIRRPRRAPNPGRPDPALFPPT